MDVVYNIKSSSLGSLIIMDNDSGYVSNNLDQESNSDSATDLSLSSIDILKSFIPKSVYISEDALLERPDLDQALNVNINHEEIVENQIVAIDCHPWKESSQEGCSAWNISRENCEMTDMDPPIQIYAQEIDTNCNIDRVQKVPDHKIPTGIPENENLEVVENEIFTKIPENFQGCTNQKVVESTINPENVEHFKNQHGSEIIPDSLENKSCLDVENKRCDIPEKRVLTNVTNISIKDLMEAGPSKAPTPQRRNSTKNKENPCENEIFKTPSKSRKRKFSEVGSPCDLFSDNESTCSKPSPSTKIMEERFVHKLDQKLIRRVQRTLSGVPPPPDLTITRLTVDDILEKLEANKSLFWTKENLEGVNNESGDKDGTLNSSHNSSIGNYSILIEGEHEEAIGKDFPNILYSRHHGLHYNRSKLSEDIEHLCDKYAMRYIGAETQSTCNAVETKYASPGRRRSARPKWAVKSPGRRLSHLAKRRITFSSASLQAATSSAASRARQILIDYKKLEVLNKKKSPKKTPLKSPSRSPGIGRTPSSSAKKKLRMRFRLLSGDLRDMMFEANSSASKSKRALFQSPDKDSNFKGSSFGSSSSSLNSFERDLASGGGAKRSLFSSPKKVGCRTSLFPSPNGGKSPFRNRPVFEKKRKREEEDENCLNRSKFFRSQSSVSHVGGEPKVSNPLSRAKSESVLTSSQNMVELSATNKKKLQWAVYDSLKDQKITMTHPQFKVFASTLARVIRRCIVSSNIRLESAGTSEKMLRIARHHVYSVVKGKSVEEIMSEVNKNKKNNLKPRGYVAPQDYHPLSSNKDFVLRDRDNNSGDSVSSSQTSVSKPESRIDRIRKVINFEDKR